MSSGVHGGDIYTEGILVGKRLLDFSSNINPLGVPESFKENINEAIENAAVYPDILYRRLKKSIEEYLNEKSIEEGSIVLGNGAAEIIDLAVSCFKRILIVVPSFSEYEASAAKWGLFIEHSYLKEDMDFDYDDIYFKMKNCDALIIGNPNNPNGKTIDKNKFLKILDLCEGAGKTVIIDEAFVEFAGIDRSFVPQGKKYNCLFIIRALTKYFALPGIRFGYGICKNTKLTDKIREKQLPWNINSFAETAAIHVLKDKDYISRTHIWINSERSYITEKLREIKYIEKVFETEANFLLIRLCGISGEKLYDLCLNNGILIRRAWNFKGLDDRYIRLAIKDRESNERLCQTLRMF